MGGNTTIEWTNKVWNPVTGCTKISPGCDHCYAARMAPRLRGRFGYPQEDPFAVTLHEGRLLEPFHWRKPSRVFVCSMSDLFHPKVPFTFIHEVFVAMAANPHLIFQVLTKRPKTMAHFARTYHPPQWEDRGTTWGAEWPENVWAMTSIEHADYLWRADALAKVPAKVRGVSLEPLLGPLDLRPWLTCNGCEGKGGWPVKSGEPPFDRDWQTCTFCWGRQRKVDWVIVGGESGPGARPMEAAWVRGILDQCQWAGVPFFFKQWGMSAPRMTRVTATDWEEKMHWVGNKKAAGSLLDGREWKEMPNA